MKTDLKFGQVILIIVVTFLWAICFPLIELGHDATTPLKFAAMRSAIAGLSLVIPLVLIKRHLFFDKTIWKYGIFLSLTYTVMGFGGMFLADGRIAPGLSTILANTQPLIAAVLAYFFLKERLGKLNFFGLIIGFLGIVIIAIPAFTGEFVEKGLVGIGFILLGAIGTGAGNVIMKKSANRCDPLVLTGIQLLVGAFILYIISESFEPRRAVDWQASFVWALIILAVPGTSVATVIWLYLLGKTQLTKLNVFTFLTPVFGLIIGFIYFNERYSVVGASGIFLILVGLYLATRTSVPKFESKH